MEIIQIDINRSMDKQIVIYNSVKWYLAIKRHRLATYAWSEWILKSWWEKHGRHQADTVYYSMYMGFKNWQN